MGKLDAGYSYFLPLGQMTSSFISCPFFLLWAICENFKLNKAVIACLLNRPQLQENVMNDHPQGMPKPNAIDNLIVFVVQLSKYMKNW